MEPYISPLFSLDELNPTALILYYNGPQAKKFWVHVHPCFYVALISFFPFPSLLFFYGVPTEVRSDNQLHQTMASIADCDY